VRALRATAQFEDQTAGQLVEPIGREVIRRSLKATEPELSHHQGRHYYWKQLCKFARVRAGFSRSQQPGNGITESGCLAPPVSRWIPPHEIENPPASSRR
jgi:hypothetical protein